MHGCIWGGSNIPPNTWIELYLIDLAFKAHNDLRRAVSKPATLADGAIHLRSLDVDTDVSTLSRMKRVTDCHKALSEKMRRIRRAVISYISLETCFVHFERQLLSSMMFGISDGDMSHHAQKHKSPNGLYSAERYSLRGRRQVTRSAFLFYRNEKHSEPLSGYSEIDDDSYSKDALSEVHRYRELRKISPLDDEPFFIHVRGFVFQLNGGFYLTGFGLETKSPKVTSMLKLADIRRSQVEHEFLEDDQNPAVVRGLKTGFLRSPAHPVSSVLHLERQVEFPVKPWDHVSEVIKIGTVPADEFSQHGNLSFEQDQGTGMLKVQTL